MTGTNNPKGKRKLARPSAARASVIQRQEAQSRREDRARTREARRTQEREEEDSSSREEEPMIMVEPKQEEGSWYFDLTEVLKWEEAPEVVLGEGPHLHVLYHEVLKHPADLSTSQLNQGNLYHFRFEETEATQYAESLIRKFQWQGRSFDQEQVDLVLAVVWGIIRAWCNVDKVDLGVKAWHDKDRKLYRIQRVTGELMGALNLKDRDMYIRLALLGHLITVPTGRSTVSGVEEVPVIIEEVLREMYKPDVTLNRRYWSREHLFWDALAVGIGFPVWMGLNRALFWDKYPDYPIFRLWHFCESYAEEYMATCQVLLQMTRHLHAVVKKHCNFQ